METTSCPKCGQEIPSNAVDCPFCGIVVAKFRNAPPRPEPSGAHAPSEAAEPPATATPAAQHSPTPAERGVLYDPESPSPVFTAAGGEGGAAPTSPYGPVTDTMVEHLNKTGPWAIFVAILTFLSSIFAGLGALLGSPAAGGQGAAVRLVSGVFAILYLVLALQLFNFGQSARMIGSSLGVKTSTERIEEALGYQRSFWRLIGILTLALIAFVVLALGLGLIGAMMARSAGGGP